VEAGAQGSHKLARGYRPVPTWSAHFIPDTGFRRAVADFLKHESAAVEETRVHLDAHAPFRKSE
jgi:predicted N-acyltransferase